MTMMIPPKGKKETLGLGRSLSHHGRFETDIWQSYHISDGRGNAPSIECMGQTHARRPETKRFRLDHLSAKTDISIGHDAGSHFVGQLISTARHTASQFIPLGRVPKDIWHDKSH
jgi:hypothetical protein